MTLYNVLKKRRIIKRNGRNGGSRKERKRRGRISQTKNKTNKSELNHTDEALALLNHLHPLAKLWRTLLSALDTDHSSRIQNLILKEASAKRSHPQLTKNWAFTEENVEIL